MKELRLGKISIKELADWFGVKEKTYRNTKQKRLGELKAYAEFEEVYGGINITKILDENLVTYKKSLSKSKEIVFNAFDEEWDKSGLDTCSHVADKIYTKYSNKLDIAHSTTYSYTRAARKEFYGVPFISCGSHGHCSYAWVKITVQDGDIKYLALNEKEEQIKKQLLKKYFSTDEEIEMHIAMEVESGEITKAEAYDKIAELRSYNRAGFMAFKRDLEEKIGSKITRGTFIEKTLVATDDIFIFE